MVRQLSTGNDGKWSALDRIRVEFECHLSSVHISLVAAKERESAVERQDDTSGSCEVTALAAEEQEPIGNLEVLVGDMATNSSSPQAKRSKNVGSESTGIASVQPGTGASISTGITYFEGSFAQATCNRVSRIAAPATLPGFPRLNFATEPPFKVGAVLSKLKTFNTTCDSSIHQVGLDRWLMSMPNLETLRITCIHDHSDKTTGLAYAHMLESYTPTWSQD